MSLMFRRLLGNVAAAPNWLVYPLTYDEDDKDGANALTRLGLAPHVTPQGMECDGYQSRYTLASLPAWLTSATARLSVTTAVTLHMANKNATRDAIVYLGSDDATANPKAELCALTAGGGHPCVGFRTRNSGGITTRFLCNWNWKYGFRFPILTEGANTVRPQTLLFLDSDTLLVCGHYNETESRCYKVQLSTGATLGSFSFGTSTHRHVAGFARRSNGDVWCLDYETGHALRVDIDASFTAGTAQITADWNLTSLGTNVLSGIEFITVSGTEYVLLGLYNPSANTWLYVIPVTEMVDGATFDVANRYKRFVIGNECQGLALRPADGLLYEVHSSGTSAPIRVLDVAAAITSLADGGTPTVIRTHSGPSQYPEDIKWHPTSGEAWVGTEGRQAIADNDGYLAYWHSPLVDDLPQENRYTIDYDGAGTFTFYINDRLFNTLSLTPNTAPAALSLGGPPAASAGWTNGFAMATVRGVALKNGPFTSDEIAALDANAFEPNALTVYTASLTNPGAESGAATGWTTESGGLGVRSSNPDPRYQPGVSNTQYFTGGTSAATLSRQRLAIATITGLTTEAIDALTAAGNLWGRVTWWQSNFNGSDDPGSLGIRWLDSTPTPLSLTYSAIIAAGLSQIWRRRTHAVLADSGAQNVDVVQRMDRTAGTNNDTYTDDIELVIYTR